MDYIANRPRVQKLGTHGLFTAGNDPLVLSQVADEEAHHPGVVWLPIISLRRDELTEGAEEVMRQLVSEMQSGTLDSQRIGQLMSELAQCLHGRSGKRSSSGSRISSWRKPRG